MRESESRSALVTIGRSKGGLMRFELGKLVIASSHEMLAWGFRDLGREFVRRLACDDSTFLFLRVGASRRGARFILRAQSQKHSLHHRNVFAGRCRFVGSVISGQCQLRRSKPSWVLGSKGQGSAELCLSHRRGAPSLCSCAVAT